VAARQKDHQDYPDCLATLYYPNVYLGIHPALAADSLRYALEPVDPRARFFQKKRDHYLAALIHALSVTTSATSHFCQPRGLSTDKEVLAVLERRSVSLASRLEACSKDMVATIASTTYQKGNRVLSHNWRQVLPGLEPHPDVVYLDPPYTADNYSRFYHLLEVMTQYDYPPLEKRNNVLSKGRYPEIRLRHQSGFCRRGSVEQEFKDVMAQSAAHGSNLVISYAEESGLLLRRYRESDGLSARAALSRFQALALEHYQDVDIRRRQLLHSGQGRKNEPATELLFVCTSPKTRRREARKTALATAGSRF
jgi:adenine-specific DNA-methyltransferase